MTDKIHIRNWHHGPSHVFAPNTFYMVTACTFKKRHIFNTPYQLQLLQNALFEVMQAFDWILQAWALFPNHYHFIALSPEDSTSLKQLIKRLHSQSARRVNQLDQATGRRVWFQYWDTCLTYEKSYCARLNYVHNNPVMHGLVTVAEQYAFCSASWFKENAEPLFLKRVAATLYDRVHVRDDFMKS